MKLLFYLCTDCIVSLRMLESSQGSNPEWEDPGRAGMFYFFLFISKDTVKVS